MLTIARPIGDRVFDPSTQRQLANGRTTGRNTVMPSWAFLFCVSTAETLCFASAYLSHAKAAASIGSSGRYTA